MREDASFKEREYYRLLVDSAPDPVVVIGEHGRLILSNPAARDASLDVALTLEAARSDVAAFRAELHQAGRASGDVRLSDRRGVSRIYALDGRRLGGDLIVRGHDVTERRALEEEVRHLRKVESLGYLTASVVHDFNNLLTPILCLSTLLGEATGDPSVTADGASMAREIRAAAERAVVLVRQVLAFTRREPGRARAVNVTHTIAEMRGLVERAMGEDVSLSLSLDPKVWDVTVDREQLEHVVLNLAANARDAMPRGGRMSIRTSNVSLGELSADDEGRVPGGDYVTISVTDTGVGMTPEVRERIFERFFTTKEIGMGTGLGLAAAHTFVTQAGGCISVRSEIGQGTTVLIHLPRAAVSLESVERARPDAALPKGNETVLVVEDDENVRRVVREVLEELGYRVLEAPCGEVALRSLDQHATPVDLVLVDVVLPRMSGRTMVQTMRSKGRAKAVLYMSGHTDRAIADHGILERDEALLRKAFSPGELARKVREVLDAQATANDSSAETA